jgi:hypothetical protein
MSMNLNATLKNGKSLELRQTPTQISYTILPEEYQIVTGKKAVEAMKRYISWVKYSTNGTWTNTEELKQAELRVKEHIRYINENLDNIKEVWVM